MSTVFPPCYVAPVAAPSEQTQPAKPDEAIQPTEAGSGSGQAWPGERLGLPPSGTGAVAGWGRRVLALFIDWFASTLAVSVFTGHSALSPAEGFERWLPLIVFAIETIALTASLGGSAGQLLVRIQVRRLGGGRLDLPRSLARTVLLCLVIPPVIYNADQRGLHDMAVGSVAVRR